MKKVLLVLVLVAISLMTIGQTEADTTVVDEEVVYVTDTTGFNLDATDAMLFGASDRVINVPASKTRAILVVDKFGRPYLTRDIFGLGAEKVTMLIWNKNGDKFVVNVESYKKPKLVNVILNKPTIEEEFNITKFD